MKSRISDTEPPSGTVTFLFTDIEGSTKMLKKLGDQYARLLSDHRVALRDVFRKWNGHEVDTQGDAFFYSFSRATEAVAAAIEAQLAIAGHAWPQGVDLRVRMGLHTGEPLVAEEGYVGMDVHRAARIGSAGHGGQVLLSETTAALVMDDLPMGVTLINLGQHRLKDVRRPEDIHQLVIEALPYDFPPLESLEKLPPGPDRDQPKHNLPAELTTFIGREKALATVMDLLEEESTRLLSLVGMGGIGKTRIAVQIAANVIDAFPDGVWLVELAHLIDPDLVPQQVASVLRVSSHEEIEGRDVGDVLAAYLKDKKLILILDNCEHLIGACAKLAKDLLASCPELKLLATSRERLGIPGEISFTVPSMEMPPEKALQRRLANSETVRLFVDRARAALPGFRINSSNRSSIVNICRRLDGIPLAIELAAARVKMFTPEQIAERLHDRFRLLSGGPRISLPRHQTLKATMEWSYSLLSESEKDLFMQLSVFSGGWSLEGAEALAQDEMGMETDVLDTLSKLVDKSLVLVERRRGLARYRMLETVRQFAAGKLFASGEADDFHRHHADLFITLAEEADPRLRGAGQLEWLDLLADEHENLRAALTWLIDSNQADGAARLVGALGWFWFLRGFWKESAKWRNEILEMPTEPRPHLRAKPLIRTGGLEIIRGNLTGTIDLVEEALSICADLADEEGMAWCLNLLGQVITWNKKDLDHGADLLTKSIELFNKRGDEWGVAWSTRYLGQIAELQGNIDQSVKLQKDALHRFESVGDIWNTAHSLYLLGGTFRDHGDLDQATLLYRESLAKCQLAGNDVIAAHALQGLGMLAVETHDYRDANEHLREALEVMQRIGDEHCASRVLTSLSQVAQCEGDYDHATELLRQSLQGFKQLNREDHIALSLGRLALLARLSGDNERAARLLGAAEAYRNTYHSVLAPVQREEFEGLVNEFIELKRSEIFEQGFAEGSAMTYQDAIAYALGEITEV